MSHGVNRFFPLTTLSFGALRVRGGAYRKPEDVASHAALAKHDAKLTGAALFVRESPAADPAAALAL